MSISVLLVDDHAMFRKGLRLLIEEEADMNVVGEAGDGKEAVEQVHTLSPDVTVMDITMPGLNGIEATQQILGSAPHTKVVALSIHAGKRFVKDMLAAGASGYILKDSAPEEMISGIRKVMQNEVYLSSKITDIVVSGFLENRSEAIASDTPGEWKTDESNTLLFTKLHRPTVDTKIVRRTALIERLDQGLQRPFTLVAAPAGYGKTTLVSCWLDSSSRPSAWVSLDKNDDNLRLFLNYLLAAVQKIFPDTCRQIQAMANALTLPPLPVLAGSLINELDRIEKPLILVLDDFHHINDESVLDLITRLMDHPPKSIHLVLISRRDPPLPISAMRAGNLIKEIRTQDLRFNRKETATFLAKALEIQVDSATIAAVDNKTEGWVTGLRLAAFSMKHQGYIAPGLLEPQTDAKYVMEYLFTEVFSHQPPEIIQFLLGTAILDRFCGPLCEAMRVQGSGRSVREISGWQFIAWLKNENLFLIPLDTENRWFRFHHLFQKLLRNQLERYLDPEDINILNAQASDWFAENGLIEEALKHALAGGDSATAARLVAQHGFDLVSEEQWPTLERWLKLIPNDIVYQDPELVVLLAWTHLVFSRNTEMTSCLDRAEALISDQRHSPKALKHMLGHLQAMRALQNYYSAEGECALNHTQRAIENIPLEHRYPRILALGVRAGAYQMIGDSEKTRSTIEEMIRDETLRGGTSEGYLFSHPCFIYWIKADLTAMLQTAGHSQKIDAALKSPWTLGHALHFLGIAYYQRNELHAAEEKLLPLVKSPYLHHPLNFSHSAFALALIYQARGWTDKANEIAESAVSYALDTNNTAVLQIARAFQAELALRQGCLAEASLWAKQFVAKPFMAMYRFYVPQLTLARVLLAQDTTDSSDKAADLFCQLYDFVVSTHNTRFQIDVLSLKALLYDSQGDAPAALKALTESLILAEPGGFIRPFVDLGSPMADLLKRLVKQNFAVEYIGRILAAFKEDEKLSMKGESEPPPTHLLDATTQPLPEPLSNREIDVLVLLAQRLTNKEIAEKLFISPGTVKKHLNNIYGKLNVSNRRQAVERAVTLGIISRL